MNLGHGPTDDPYIYTNSRNNAFVPTQMKTPFIVTQLSALLVFSALTITSIMTFRVAGFHLQVEV